MISLVSQHLEELDDIGVGDRKQVLVELVGGELLCRQPNCSAD